MLISVGIKGTRERERAIELERKRDKRRPQNEENDTSRKEDRPQLKLLSQPRLSLVKSSSSSDGNGDLVDRGPTHQIFYEDARNALAAFQQAGDDESLSELATAIDSLGGAAADAASLAAAAESRAESAEAELETAKDSLLRLRAEFENFRRRTEGEKAALAAKAKAEAVEALVPLADSFDAAAALLASAASAESSLDESSPAAKVASAYGGLQKQLLDAFRGVGVTPVAGEGSPFDPNVHEAVMRELDDSVPDGTVLQEFRRGYVMGDRLVRAAMVKVSYTEGDAGAGAAGAKAAVAGGGGSESE